MMAKYLRLFSLAVEHEFYAESAAWNFDFAPSKACEAMLEREAMLLRNDANKLEIWQETCDVQTISTTEKSTTETLQFSFDVMARDPSLLFFTEWQQENAREFHNQLPNQSGAKELLVAIACTTAHAPRRDTPSAPAKPSVLSKLISNDFKVELALDRTTINKVVVTQELPSKQYVVALKAKKFHWKYFFSGTLARKKLTIVDLNAEEGGEGVNFIASSHAATSDGMALLSEVALPLEYLSKQRFQLREEGVAGKVLIRRLPNASIDKLGKERGSDGQSLTVAEIYIHQ